MPGNETHATCKMDDLTVLYASQGPNSQRVIVNFRGLQLEFADVGMLATFGEVCSRTADRLAAKHKEPTAPIEEF